MNKHYQKRITELQKFRQSVKLGQKCFNCGESRVEVLDFAHYNRSDKKMGLGHTRTINDLTKELNKGRFLCIWCHRLETRKEIDKIVKNKSDFEYTSEELEIEVDSKGKKCNGLICEGQMRHSSLFYKHNNRLNSRCKKCFLYKDFLRRESSRKYVNEVKLKMGKCSDCSVKVKPETTFCFDFDHIDRKNKKIDISRMVTRGYSSELIDTEIAKCRLLCCKCHRIFTFKQMNYIDYNKPLKLPEQEVKKDKPIVDKPKKVKKDKPIIKTQCIECFKEIDRKATRCEPCYRINSRKCERPSLEILLKDIENLNYLGTGKKYGVSDNAIRKWVKMYQRSSN